MVSTGTTELHIQLILAVSTEQVIVSSKRSRAVFVNQFSLRVHQPTVIVAHQGRQLDKPLVPSAASLGHIECPNCQWCFLALAPQKKYYTYMWSCETDLAKNSMEWC